MGVLLRLHTGLLAEVLEQPEQVLQGLSHPELGLLESNVNSFDSLGGIPPLSQITDNEQLEEYYSYTSFLAVRHNVRALAERLAAVPASDLLGFVRELLPSASHDPIDVYLFPLGHPMGDAYVRDIEGVPAIFVNLAIVGSIYGKTIDRQFTNLLPVLEHEIFHILFQRWKSKSQYWQSYRQQSRLLDEFKAVVLEEGIAHFVGHRGQLQNYLRDQRECLQRTLNKYHETMVRLSLGSVGETEARSLLMGGVVGPFFEKYLAVPGMLAAHAIYQEHGVKGLQRALDDVTYFEENGVSKLTDILR